MGFIFWLMSPQCSNTYCCKGFPSIELYLFLFQKLIAQICWDQFSGFCFLHSHDYPPQIPLCLGFHNYMSGLNLRKNDSSHFIFFFQNSLGYFRTFPFLSSKSLFSKTSPATLLIFLTHISNTHCLPMFWDFDFFFIILWLRTVVEAILWFKNVFSFLIQSRISSPFSYNSLSFKLFLSFFLSIYFFILILLL